MTTPEESSTPDVFSQLRASRDHIESASSSLDPTVRAAWLSEASRAQGPPQVSSHSEDLAGTQLEEQPPPFGNYGPQAGPWTAETAAADLSVGALVARLVDGDQEAWAEIVGRYSALISSICLRYQLSRQDIDDVDQSVWLLLVENIGNLRDAAALPGWLATVTRREIFRLVRASRRHEHANLPPEGPDTDIYDDEGEYVGTYTDIWGEILLERATPLLAPDAPISRQIEMHVLCDTWMIRLGSYREHYEAALPKRSHDCDQYRRAIVTVAKQLIWEATYEQPQGTAGDLLKAAYPDWFDQPGVKPSTLYRRMFRANRDLRELLHKVIRRDELT